jgi:hypothetical protein
LFEVYWALVLLLSLFFGWGMAVIHGFRDQGNHGTIHAIG